jgi:hypothetical protein
MHHDLVRGTLNGKMFELKIFSNFVSTLLGQQFRIIDRFFVRNRKFTTGIVVPGGNFTADVINTDGKFTTGIVEPGGNFTATLLTAMANLPQVSLRLL